MSSFDQKVKFRASTARVDVNVLRGKLFELEDTMMERTSIVAEESKNENTCEFDLKKHVVSYLPTPVAKKEESDRSVTSPRMKLSKAHTKKNLMSDNKFLGLQDSERSLNMRASMAAAMQNLAEDDMDMDPKFNSMIGPNDMRLLALVSHNNMKASMRQFVKANMNVLKKFRLTGTNTTMSMLKEVFGDDPDVIYGPSCKSGPLGGDAQLVAMAVTGQLGGCIFFIDPMDAHPHSADIECLVRQGNVHNILMMNNPSTAHVCMNTLRIALKMGRMEMMPSFFFDLESPSVDAYKQRQNAVLQSAISRVSIVLPTRENQVKKSMLAANEKFVKFQETQQEEAPSDDGSADVVEASAGKKKKKDKKKKKKKFGLF